MNHLYFGQEEGLVLLVVIVENLLYNKKSQMHGHTLVQVEP